MTSQEYWDKCAVILNERLLDMGDDFYARLSTEYDRAISRIEKEIESFYARYATDNKVSFAEAKKLLTSSERRSLMLDINEYIEKGKSLPYSPEWAARLENASTAHRVSRLQSLQLQMAQQVEELHAKYDAGMTETARKVLNEGYYRSIFEEQKEAGQGAPFATLDTEQVKKVIATPWAPDGSNFSAKIWKDRTGLVEFLNRELPQAFIRGENAVRLIKEIKKKFDVSSKNAARLVQTEMAFFSAMAKLESYKALGYSKYIIVAVVDARTSAICRDMDGVVVDIDDFQPGVTANPFHPRCRTTTAPYVPSGSAREGMKYYKDGEIYRIPQDMSYEEWYDRYVAAPHKNEPAAPVTDGEPESSSGSGNIFDLDMDIPEVEETDEPEFVEQITPDMVDKRLEEYENIIKDNDYETAYVIQPDGNVYRFIGEQSNVRISGISLKDAIITHNHPLNEWGESDSFGRDDFYIFQIHPEVKEYRAVNPFYRYKLKLLEPLDVSYHELYIPGLQMAVDAKTEEQQQHYIMEYLKGLGYIDYTRERING